MAHTIEYCTICHARANEERPDKEPQYIINYKIIKLFPETHKELQKLGMKGETMGDMIRN
jgi:hypothetical protein